MVHDEPVEAPRAHVLRLGTPVGSEYLSRQSPEFRRRAGKHSQAQELERPLVQDRRKFQVPILHISEFLLLVVVPDKSGKAPHAHAHVLLSEKPIGSENLAQNHPELRGRAGKPPPTQELKRPWVQDSRYLQVPIPHVSKLLLLVMFEDESDLAPHAHILSLRTPVGPEYLARQRIELRRRTGKFPPTQEFARPLVQSLRKAPEGGLHADRLPVGVGIPREPGQPLHSHVFRLGTPIGVQERLLQLDNSRDGGGTPRALEHARGPVEATVPDGRRRDREEGQEKGRCPHGRLIRYHTNRHFKHFSRLALGMKKAGRRS